MTLTLSCVYAIDISRHRHAKCMDAIHAGEHIVEHSTLFKNNRSQAVRLPKGVAFPDGVKEVDVIPVGRGRLILPANDTWDAWFDGPQASPDFMEERQQPQEEQREHL